LSGKKSKNVFTIGIANIGVSFLFDQTLSELGIEDINDVFLTDVSDEIRLHVHYGSVPELNRIEKIFDSGSTWAFYRRDGKYVLQDDRLIPASSPNVVVVLEPDPASGDVYIKNDFTKKSIFPDPLGYPLNQILMILLLSKGEGMIFHACGIDDGGCGYLFLGNSTHGKSTMARLWFEQHATILNDDRIVVRKKDSGFWMYGTPWHGDFKEFSPKGLEIHKIFILHPQGKNSAVPKNGAEGVAMLLARSFPPLWDHQGMVYTADLCHGLVEKIPCHELNFEPDTRVVDFVRSL